MTFKKAVIACVALCITAILWVALCGCDDLGAYEDTNEYYSAFGDVVMIDGATKVVYEFPVEDHFYNEKTRENFDNGIEHRKYVYIAIPFEKDIEMDSFALYLQSTENVLVYMNFYVVDKLPLNWRPIGDNVIGGGQTDGTETGDISVEGGTETGDGQTNDGQTDEGQTDEGGTSGEGSEGSTENGQPSYDDPSPDGRMGEIVIHLEKDEWNSFVLEKFTVIEDTVGEVQRESIQIKADQYLLIQIRNNSGVRELDVNTGAFVDPQTKLELPEASITATNLLIRALDIKEGNREQGGE